MLKMGEIAWDDFESVDLRVGTIVGAEDFPLRAAEADTQSRCRKDPVGQLFVA